MISTLPVHFTFKGKPATMRVFRNNGYCWGRLNVSDGREYDVETARDHYDEADDTAAEAFIRAAKRGNYQLVVGWEGA